MPSPKVRAALLAVVIAVHGVAAAPLPNGVSEGDFKNPIARDEMRRWSEILKGVGIEATPEELAKTALGLGKKTSELRKTLLKPFGPIFRVSGTGQGWGLFTYPNSYPHRMEIDMRVGDQWQTLFRALDPEHTWMEHHLTYRRVRGVYDDNVMSTRSSYNNFVRWIAKRAFEDFPQAEAVRVRMIRSHVVLPGAPPDPETTVRLIRTVQRDAPGVVK